MSTKKSKEKSKEAPLGNQQCDSAENISVNKNGELWGKQTQLSLKYFAIGKHIFGNQFIDALVSIKRACAQVNHRLELLSNVKLGAIVHACDAVLNGEYYDQFPLRVWQTGSGTQTNMNINEVVASLANVFMREHSPKGDANDAARLHPNDHINMSQSSNDVFPTAMHIVVAKQAAEMLLPSIERIGHELCKKQKEFESVHTVARTHLMDALPISAGALLSAHESQITAAKLAVQESLSAVYQLALGGTAVGSGANAPALFGQHAIALLAEQYQLPFIQHPNLYAAVSGEDALVRFSSSLKQLAVTLFKLANDFRLLGSGPRCGLNEWKLPANEPGSSIMPGKVNPTQCEALSMVCLQVFGNDLTVSLAASNGQLQLNTYRPVIIHNILESIELLSDAMSSFTENCIRGLKLNHAQIDSNMRNNLSVITLLAPTLGYDVAAQIAYTADQQNVSLVVAAESLGLYEQEKFESLLQKQLNANLLDKNAD